ncbi:hypothetical protein D3C86_1558050 [compost metagenome]
MAILTFHLREVFMQNINNSRMFCQHPQDIQAHDIARAFPDTVHRHLTVDARQLALFAITYAPKHFHCFGDKRHPPFAHAVFSRRGKEPRPGRFLRIVAPIPCARQTEQQRGLSFELQRHPA